MAKARSPIVSGGATLKKKVIKLVLYKDVQILHNDTAIITAPFNNMRTLKFKVQPINGFSATVNQMLGGSSQLPTTAEHCFVV